MKPPRKYYETTIVIKLLTTDMDNSIRNALDNIQNAIKSNYFAGEIQSTTTEKINSSMMARELKKQQYEPSFFNLDDDGNEVEA